MVCYASWGEVHGVVCGTVGSWGLKMEGSRSKLTASLVVGKIESVVESLLTAR